MPQKIIKLVFRKKSAYAVYEDGTFASIDYVRSGDTYLIGGHKYETTTPAARSTSGALYYTNLLCTKP
jgi:hypothetical protein